MKEMKKIMERQIDYSRNSHELYKDVVMIADLLKAEYLNQEEADILCRYAIDYNYEEYNASLFEGENVEEALAKAEAYFSKRNNFHWY